MWENNGGLWLRWNFVWGSAWVASAVKRKEKRNVWVLVQVQRSGGRWQSWKTGTAAPARGSLSAMLPTTVVGSVLLPSDFSGKR